MCPGSAPASISHDLPSDVPPRREPTAGIPLKRILEDDDIEFVSEKPVKKQRIAAERAAVAKSSADIAQRPDTYPPVGLLYAVPSKVENADTAREVLRTEDNNTPTAPSSVGHSAGRAQDAEPRGDAMAGMEAFAFPQSFPAQSMPRYSPQISPKQLPQPLRPMPPRPEPMQTQHQYLEPFLPFSDMLMQPTYPVMDAYNFMDSLPPHMAMMPEVGLNMRPVHDSTSTVPSERRGHDDGKAIDRESNLMTLANVAGSMPSSEPENYLSSHEPPTAQIPDHHTPPGSAVPSDPRAATSNPGAVPSSSEAHHSPTTSVPGSPSPSQHQSVPPSSHPQAQQMAPPAKKPCLICARARQQACLNNSHGMAPPGHPLLSQAYTHAIPGHAVPMQHGMPPAFSMRHLNSALETNALVSLPSSYISPHAGSHIVPVHAAERGQTPTRDDSPSPTSQAPDQTAAKPSPKSRQTGAPNKKPVIVTAASGRLGGNGTASATTADGKRKPAPNIYVDIAETCLDMFPFAEVARRHGVSRQRVHDVFAAVIQLPLLRCPTDKRRVGKLGVTRMKEYNKAKKEVSAEKQRVAAQKLAQKQVKAGGVGEGGQQARATPPPAAKEPPNLYEVANYMGPLDMPEEFRQGFPGSW